MEVRDVMTGHVLRISAEEPVSVAARMLARYNVGALPVCKENGSLCGILTDRDIILRCVACDRDPEKTPVAKIMTRKVVTVPGNIDIQEAARQMGRQQIRRLPVEENGKLCGMVSLSDLTATGDSAAKALGEICSGLSSR